MRPLERRGVAMHAQRRSEYQMLSVFRPTASWHPPQRSLVTSPPPPLPALELACGLSWVTHMYLCDHRRERLPAISVVVVDCYGLKPQKKQASPPKRTGESEGESDNEYEKGPSTVISPLLIVATSWKTASSTGVVTRHRKDKKCSRSKLAPP
ncbi:hypothetical protein EDB85DRAFT_1234995 [Lactarius pseudohatsudake]|nr:hypothetical protein EDB85DRAFT_1234995 [Lactarius pseudohatsudake]